MKQYLVIVFCLLIGMLYSETSFAETSSNGVATTSVDASSSCTTVTLTVNVTEAGDYDSRGYTITVPSGVTLTGATSGTSVSKPSRGSKNYTLSTTSSGTYTVSVSGTNFTIDGQVDGTGTQTITFKKVPSVSAPSAPTDICSGQKISPSNPTVNQNNGTQSGSGWQWSSSSGGTYEN